ncbi:DUF1345 domain-containing protein [Variovorax robiniae]|uniref:DUF1345 domain-containing protein n=1 Tax=Variovorax robiniae TaxID=1836199 RepID=A0ABU8XI40_9BURK
MRKHLSTTTGIQRLSYGAAVGVAVALIPSPLINGMARGLLGWVVGVAVYLALAWWLAHSFDAQQTRERAQSLDQPNLILLLTMLTVIAFSVAAIAMLLQQVKLLAGLERGAHIVLAMVALAESWLMIHTIYAFHYAHRYYQQEKTRKPDNHGLDFPGTAPPDYADFMYYSYVIGMTSQVSDVQILSPAMRRITLIHSVLSFAFNMLVLAFSVNVVVGAL